MGSGSDGDDYEGLATLVAVALAPFTKHRQASTAVLLLVFVKNEDNRHLRHVVVDARDRRQRRR